MDKSPDAFRTISEAAEELDLPQHVLRFWETRFSQIKPLKRGGGRRWNLTDVRHVSKGHRHVGIKSVLDVDANVHVNDVLAVE